MAKIINDVIHGHFDLSDIAVKIVDTPEFQRLRNLKQLGLTYYVYPCAMHSRFEHSLGTYYLAKKYMTALKNNQPELGISDKDIEIVGIAGLCHDLGHGVFSHSFEGWVNRKYNNTPAMKKPLRHEELSVLILRKIHERYIKYSDEYNFLTDEDIDDIELMIRPSLISDVNMKKQYKYQIVCNSKTGIDVDKFDYILRDSYYTNKPQGFDYERLIISSRVINNEICYREKEVYNIYELFRTRYSMHRQVYLHKVTRAIEFMMMDILDIADGYFKLSTSTHNIDNYLKYDDSILKISEYVLSDTPKFINLTHRLSTRDLYKCVYSRIYDENEWQEYNVSTIEKSIKNELNNSSDIENVRVDITKSNYGMGNKNPVDSVMFYTANDLYKSSTMPRDKVSTLLPHKYIEYHLRIYTTNRSINEELIKIAEKLF